MKKFIPTAAFIFVVWWGYTALSRLHNRLEVVCGDRVDCSADDIAFIMLALLTAFAAFAAVIVVQWAQDKLK